MADGFAGILKVQPNPARNTVAIEIETMEIGRTQLMVTDMFGRVVLALADEEPAPGRRQYSVDTGSLSTGLYTLVLTTPTQRRTTPLRVIK